MDSLSLVAEQPRSKGVEWAKQHWPLVAGLLVLGIPTLAALGSQAWTRESGIHGPIVLATGTWLLVRAWPSVQSVRGTGSRFVFALLLIGALLGYVFGRAFEFLSLEVASFVAVLIATVYLYLGMRVIKLLWFPILYLCFVIPLPGWLVDGVTAPLKAYISSTATWLLAAADYPIVREGVTIYIAQYQLLVEDACSGLNSIISLTAIGLFYIYLLHNASWRYAGLLMLWILPAALLANLVRVIALVLITYYFGNAMAQGFLHSTAGLLMFVTALLGIFAVDSLMSPLRRRLARSEA
jgi:exosortase B